MKANNEAKNLIKNIAVILLWLAVWQIAYIIIGRDVLFASPADTLKALIELCTSLVFYKTIAQSFLRIVVGFFIGSTIGIILGIATGFSKILYTVFKPIISVVRAAPVASFIILALAWMKSGEVPVFIAFLTVTPIIWSNLSEGIASVDIKLLEMAKIYEYPWILKLRKIYLPAVLPYIKSAAVTGVGFAWKSGVAAEVIGNPKFSVGSKLYEAKVYLETPQLFAWTGVIIILSVLFEKIIVRTVNVRKRTGR